jgi:TPR repeat protein
MRKDFMKYIGLIVLIFLSGCQYMGIDSEPEEKETAVINDSNDDEFLGIAKDLFAAKQYKQSYQIVRKLAERNNPEAHYLLGYMLYYGYGVKADKEQGAGWIKKAADAGNRSAIEALVMIQYNLTPDKKCPAPNLKP